MKKMKLNFIAPKEKPRLRVYDMEYDKWFSINGVHFIRMGIRDGEICCFGTLVQNNHKIYDNAFMEENGEYDCVSCFNLEEQMLVYIDKHIIVDDYGDYEINLFRK